MYGVYHDSHVVPSGMDSLSGRQTQILGAGSHKQLTPKLRTTEKDSESWPILRPANYAEPLLYAVHSSLYLLFSPWHS